MSIQLNTVFTTDVVAFLRSHPLYVNDRDKMVGFRDLEGATYTNAAGTSKGRYIGEGAPAKKLRTQRRKAVWRVDSIKRNQQDSDVLIVAGDIELARSVLGATTFGIDINGNKTQIPNQNSMYEVRFHPQLPNRIEEFGNYKFKAYYLPWRSNHATMISLGVQANYFFTSSLSGCAVHVFGNPQSPTVIHANRTSKEEIDGFSQQEYIDELLQTASGRDQPRRGSATLKKDQYKAMYEKLLEAKQKKSLSLNKSLVGQPNSKATVLGVRTNRDGWKIYMQQWVFIEYDTVKTSVVLKNLFDIKKGIFQKEQTNKKRIYIKQLKQIWPIGNAFNYNLWKPKYR